MNSGNSEPNPEVAKLADRRVKLERQLKETRQQLAVLIREDAERGVRQADIVRASKYTREQIRRICDTSKNN